MTTRARYFLALLPALLSIGGWQVAELGYTYTACQGNLKGFRGCTIATFDVTALIGFGLFWCQVLSWFTVPISLWLVFSTWTRSRYGPPASR